MDEENNNMNVDSIINKFRKFDPKSLTRKEIIDLFKN